MLPACDWEIGSPRHAAASCGDVQMMAAALQREGVNEPTEKGTALHVAAAAGHLRMCAYLVMCCDADLTARMSTGDTALHLAARWGHAPVVRFFLQSLVDTTLANHLGQTAREVAPDAIKAVFDDYGRLGRLSFTRQPEDVEAGDLFAVRVEVLDRDGRKMIPASPCRITLSLQGGKQAVLLGELSKQVGLTGAFFSKLAMPFPGKGHLLVATADNASLLPCTSRPFDVSCRLSVALHPGDPCDISDPITVEVQAQDVADHLVLCNVPVHLTVDGPSGTFVNEPDPLEVITENGAQRFSGLRLSHVGRGHVVVAQSAFDFVRRGTSLPFTVKGRLVFTAPPTDVEAGVPFSVTVQVQGRSGQRVETCRTLITVALATTSPSTVLSGGLTTRMSDDGEATFPDLIVRTPGTGFVLTATTSELQGVVDDCQSAAFTVLGRLAFASPPSPLAVGSLFSVKVLVVGSDGAPIPSACPHISLALSRGGAGSVLRQAVNGISTKRATRGEVVFKELSIDSPATDYTLIATSESTAIVGVQSEMFAVMGWLGFTASPPARLLLGETFAVTLQVQDDIRRRFQSKGTTVTLSLADGCVGTLQGTVSRRFERWELVFPGLSLTHPGRGLTLQATADLGALHLGISTPFDAVAQLLIEECPRNVRVKEPFSLRVCARHLDGPPFRQPYTVRLRAVSRRAATELLGQTAQGVGDDGYAVFHDVMLSNAAGDVRIEATADLPGLDSGQSPPITVAASLSFARGPVSGPIGQRMTIRVAAIDALGELLPTSADLVLAVLPAVGTADVEFLDRYYAQMVDGIAEFPELLVPCVALGLRLEASSPLCPFLAPCPSDPFDVHATLAFEPHPDAVEADTEVDLEVTVRDCHGAVVPFASPTVQLRVQDAPGVPYSTLVLAGETVQKAERGRALFRGLRLTAATERAMVTAIVADNPAIAHASMEVGVTAQLVFLTAPQGAVVANAPFACHVQVSNSAGHHILTPMPLTVALVSTLGAPGTLLCRNAPAGSGLFSETVFGGLSIDTPGEGYVMVASAPVNKGIRPCRSAPFAVTGTLHFREALGGCSVGEDFSVVVELVDHRGQQLPNASGRISVSLVQSDLNTAVLGGDPQWFHMSAGVAVVPGLRFLTPGTGCVLRAVGDSAVIQPGLSSAFSVAARLRFHTPPPIGGVGTPFEVGVELLDTGGHRIPAVGMPIRLSLKQGPPFGSLLGSLEQHLTEEGTVTFSGLQVDTPGHSFRLMASSPMASIESCVSPIFHATARLDIVEAPLDGIEVWGQFCIKVLVVDDQGQQVRTAKPVIHLHLKEGAPVSRIGGGAVTLVAEGGAAYFYRLHLDAPGVYCIVATAEDEAIEPAMSVPFAVRGSLLVPEPPRKHVVSFAAAQTVVPVA
eukprot:GGOE01043622.1.p1 GENE.GGOE01043622.1~~GGOE01043622.1.p1  ORF type:complete len:1389 (-),score=329.58 GGOE01043622.1:411-4577(-)